MLFFFSFPFFFNYQRTNLFFRSHIFRFRKNFRKKIRRCFFFFKNRENVNHFSVTFQVRVTDFSCSTNNLGAVSFWLINSSTVEYSGIQSACTTKWTLKYDNLSRFNYFKGVFFRKNETLKRNHKKWQLKKVVKFNGQTDRQMQDETWLKSSVELIAQVSWKYKYSLNKCYKVYRNNLQHNIKALKSKRILETFGW